MKTLRLILALCLLIAQPGVLLADTLPTSSATAYDVPSATDTTARVAVSTIGSTQIALNGVTEDPATITYQVDGSGCTGCTAPSHGVLSNLSTGTGIVVYTPTSGYTGNDSFTYKVTNGTTTSSAGTVRLTVTNSRTTLTGTLVDASGTALTGTVTFYLSQTAVNPTSTGAIVSPAGLISPTSSVSATLTAGVFSVSLYPSVSLSPQAYYVMEHRTTAGLRSGLVRVFAVPASTSTVNIATCGCEVTDANLRARFVWASEAMSKNALNLSRQFTVATDGVEAGSFDTINLVAGANISLAAVDNLDGSVSITITDPTGGSGGTVSSGTVGRLAKYSGTTSVNALTIGTANQFVKVNSTTNGYNHVTPTAGNAGISINLTDSLFEISNAGVTTINSLTPSSGNINHAVSIGTCGSDPGVTASGSTVTTCIPSASATANGTITAGAQTMAGPKTIVDTSSDAPLTVQTIDSSVAQYWKTEGGTVIGAMYAFEANLPSPVNGLYVRSLGLGDVLSAPGTSVGTGVLYVSETEGAAALTGIRSHIISTAGSSGLQMGIYSRRFLDGTGNYTNTSNSSIRGELTWSGGGTLTQAAVFRGELISDDTGTCTQCDVFVSNATLNTAGVVNLAHFRAVAYTGDATVVNQYGLYLPSITGATTINDAIYTNDGLVSFGDRVDIRGQSSASVSNSGEVRLWYDLPNNLWKASVNGDSFSVVERYLSGSASLDFGSISANSCTTHATTITVSGATADKPVWLGIPNAAAAAGVVYTARVSATNTVSITGCNVTGSGVDPSAGTFTVRVGR